MAASFIDTNILIYLASGDARKADAAEEAVRAGGYVSVQVLNEFANVARRKLGFSWTEVHAFLASCRALLDVVPLTTDVHDLGLRLAERYQLSVYDAMIAAAALESGCDRLLSEDLQDGMTIEGLVIANPLKGLG
ncbi:MAG: PIN domain-containing protein [Alphaproteobacteria bacterium]|nr:PIN domain-containing protein [Alphaproteobacteria bacterium]MBU1548327.1 PIN domain-containing protein [Alphaproteobacteria bacterium]MBU2335911.1 PIN domain-containing protein [Alphaproteobacteria bacterium]MBU2390694.1 PIN domain-containing protein [Alphaproteobacteria bacterium]